MTTTMNNEFERTKSVLIGVDNVDDIDLSDDDNGEPVFSLKKYEEEERAQFQEFQANYQDILLDRYISTIENRTEKLVSRNVAAVNDFVNGLSKKRALEKARDTTEEAQPKAPARIWLIPTKSALPEVYPVTESKPKWRRRLHTPKSKSKWSDASSTSPFEPGNKPGECHRFVTACG